MEQAFTLLFGLVGVVALAKKAVDLVTWARNGNWDPVVKTVVCIVVAIGATFLLAETDVPVSFEVGDVTYTLSSLSGATLAYVGLALGAIASFGVDFLSAIDQTRSSSIGTLLKPPPPEG